MSIQGSDKIFYYFRQISVKKCPDCFPVLVNDYHDWSNDWQCWKLFISVHVALESILYVNDQMTSLLLYWITLYYPSSYLGVSCSSPQTSAFTHSKHMSLLLGASGKAVILLYVQNYISSFLVVQVMIRVYGACSGASHCACSSASDCACGGASHVTRMSQDTLGEKPTINSLHGHQNKQKIYH
jgi:hypothetical protein